MGPLTIVYNVDNVHFINLHVTYNVHFSYTLLGVFEIKFLL